MSRMGQQARAVPSRAAVAVYSQGMPKNSTLARREMMSATGQAFQAAIFRPLRAMMSQRIGSKAIQNIVTADHPSQI